MPNLDLSTLSRRTGIDPAKLHFCFDNNLVPPRTWFTHEGEIGELPLPVLVDHVLLACAALFLTAGCTPSYAHMLMHVITHMPAGGRNSLNLPEIANVIMSKSPAVLQLADGTLIRWIIAGDDSGWVRFSPTRRCQPDYDPMVIIALDIARIRDLVKSEAHK